MIFYAITHPSLSQDWSVLIGETDIAMTANISFKIVWFTLYYGFKLYSHYDEVNEQKMFEQEGYGM